MEVKKIVVDGREIIVDEKLLRLLVVLILRHSFRKFERSLDYLKEFGVR